MIVIFTSYYNVLQFSLSNSLFNAPIDVFEENYLLLMYRWAYSVVIYVWLSPTNIIPLEGLTILDDNNAKIIFGKARLLIDNS